MLKAGHNIATKYHSPNYIGDYFVLASKRSQFHFVALTRVETFALSKSFLFTKIFPRFKGLHTELLVESFYRYVRLFRGPTVKVRSEKI